MNKFKIGDKVRVINPEIRNQDYAFGITDEMTTILSSDILTIEGVTKCRSSRDHIIKTAYLLIHEKFSESWMYSEDELIKVFDFPIITLRKKVYNAF